MSPFKRKRRKTLSSSQDIHDYFVEAVKMLAKEKPRGVITEIAQHMGMTPQRVNDAFSGRISLTESRRTQMSDFFGWDYEELVAYGRKLVAGQNIEIHEQGKDIYLDAIKLFWPHLSEENREYIYELVVDIFESRGDKYLLTLEAAWLFMTRKEKMILYERIRRLDCESLTAKGE